MINVIKTAIPGVTIIEPKVFNDPRGYFFESFSERDFKQTVLEPLERIELPNGIKPFANIGKLHFVQDNESMSSYGVMRGLHFQTPPFTQSKLVRCVKGVVLDVAVDIRKGSPTYGQHVECLLCAHDEEGKRIAAEWADSEWAKSLPKQGGLEGLQFFVPRGFAHGFAVLSETAVFQYKCDNYYAPQADCGISILDDSLGINWRIPLEKALLSEKDTKHALLKDFDSPFSIDMDLYPEFKKQI